MAARTDLTWWSDVPLVFRMSPTVDGVPVVAGARCLVGTGPDQPIGDRTDASVHIAVAGDTLTITLPPALRIHTWWRVDVSPAGIDTVVGYGLLQPRDA